MPKISLKGQKMPESPIRKLAPYAEKAKKEGKVVYHLNIGQPDIPTPPDSLKAVREANLTVIEYSHSAGNLSYREKLSAFYKEFGIHVTPDEMLVTTGGSEAIKFTLMSCLDEGDEIIVPEPFYANYKGFITEAGVNIIPVTSVIEEGFALPPIEEIEDLITEKTKAILINNPNNPTGYLYSEQELLKLREIVLKHDLYLFSDEVYSEFCYTNEPFISVMHLPGLEQHAILIDSISKRYSSCGIRIGCLITRNESVIQTALKFAQARLSPPSLGQIAAEAAIQTNPSYLKDVYNEYYERRNYIVEALNAIEGVYCPSPKGAFYVMARLPVPDADEFCQWILKDFDYQNQTLMLAPGPGFYSTPGLGQDEIRIAYVIGLENLKKAIKVLEEGLKVYPYKKAAQKQYPHKIPS